MTFLAPLGLLAFLGVAAVVVLHLFRRRFRERRVAALFLFAPDALPAHAGRTRTRLLRTPSFWLELLAATALALLLAGLAIRRGESGVHLVLVVDDSASMGATGGGGSAADRVRSFVDRRLAEGDVSRATLILTAPVPEIRVGPRVEPERVQAALETWQPGRPSHAPDLALELARDLAGPRGEIVFLTDHEAGPVGRGVRQVGVGRPLANGRIASALRSRDGEVDRIQADLVLHGERPVGTTARLEAVAPTGTREIARRDVTLDPDATTRLSFEVPATDLPLVVRLDDDALALDDAWTLLPDPQRLVPVSIALDDETRALLRLDRVLAAVGGTRVVEREAGAALRFGAAPGRPPAGTIEVVVGVVGDETDAWMGPYLLERKRALGGGDAAPLLQGVRLDGVIWTAGRGAVEGLPLVLADEVVLLAEVPVGRATRLVLNLDPARSNLAASPDWPILVANVVAAARTRLPGPGARNLRVGDEIVWRRVASASPEADPVLVDPSGARRPARGVEALAWEARVAGIHRLLAGDREIARFAASFADAAESDLQGAATFDRAARPRDGDGADERAPGRWILRVLALVALAAFALDVWVLGVGRRAP